MPHASTTVRKHRSPAQWAALLARFERADLSVSAFCARESISVANFYRQRGLHRTEQPDDAVASAPAFVDLGAIDASSAGARLEIKLDLGGGVVLHLVRG